MTLPQNTVCSDVTSISPERKALRRNHKIFKDSVDPDYLVTVLNSHLLLTYDEHEKATHRSLTDTEKLLEILRALERRISADPKVFHTMLQILMTEPALKAVGHIMKGIFIPSKCITKIFWSHCRLL